MIEIQFLTFEPIIFFPSLSNAKNLLKFKFNSLKCLKYSFVYSTMKVLYEIWRMPLGPPILGNSLSYLDQLNRSSIAWYICMIRRISFNVSFTGLGLPHLPRLGPLVDVIKLFLEEI